MYASGFNASHAAFLRCTRRTPLWDDGNGWFLRKAMAQSRLFVMSSKTKRSDGVARKITHPVRFADDEYEQLKVKAYNARVSLTEFIRRAALRRQVVEPPPPPQLNWKLYEELNSIGVNLNQIAKAVNRAVKSGKGANVDVERLQNLVTKLNASIRETQMQLLECGVTPNEEE